MMFLAHPGEDQAGDLIWMHKGDSALAGLAAGRGQAEATAQEQGQPPPGHPGNRDAKRTYQT